MKKIGCLTILLTILPLAMVVCQQVHMDIPYIIQSPSMDGMPDYETGWRSFATTDATGKQDSIDRPEYMTGWNQEFLYLLIRFRSDSLIVRDRAYQNGDGFHLVVASAGNREDTTDEFYVLRFSPGDSFRNVLPKRGIWYYNKDLSGRSLSASTQFHSASRDGFQYFELLLPWSEIPPYHPMSDRPLGMNLCLVRACGSSAKAGYYWLYDRLMQSENSPRKFVPARFEFPEHFSGVFTRPEPEWCSINQGDSLALKVVTVSGAACPVQYQFRVKSADRYTYFSSYHELLLDKGVNRFSFSLPTGRLQPGGYLLFWKDAAGNEGEIPFSVLPAVRPEKESATLEALASRATPGTLSTLQFRLKGMVDARKALHPYETAGALREDWNSFQAYTDALQAGRDSLASQEGILRRAFRSPYDQTLQPYSVKIPARFDPGRRYPVVVMLHGSGSDDRDIIGSALPGTDEWIVVAPCGRGTSNCFTTGHASEDVMEALADVMVNYPVDTTRIIIAGFSMGGYGAMRVFWQFPDVFRGVAVLSGHPNLATKWIGEGHPDFLQENFLDPFRDVPVFIYHSRNDLNCPFALVEQMTDRLGHAGAMLTVSISEMGGHGVMDETAAPLFRKWVNAFPAK